MSRVEGGAFRANICYAERGSGGRTATLWAAPAG
jgi:hypothetical protein